MKITGLRIRELDGTLDRSSPLWEERIVRPIDIYPAYADVPDPRFSSPDEGPHPVRQAFLEIHTDEGVTGLSGPLTSSTEAFIIDTELRPVLMGADPLATELLWDQMYRIMIHGRKGDPMMAVSAVDCCLWDIKGKWLSQPVYRLLGGPTRTEIPAYASALGYSHEPGKIVERAKELVAEGYKATKWFFRYGPADGAEGMARNLRLAQTLREAVGPDVDIMLDAWNSWDVSYAIKMAERLAEYDLRWLEEPVMPDNLSGYVEIRAASPVPISGGEHEYTRWGFRQIVETRAMDILQPDIYWAGGISETLKICALASSFGLPVIPHGHSAQASAHLIASQPPSTCPIQEYLIRSNTIAQLFLKEKLEPRNGMLSLPEGPGLGMELDESAVREERVLTWADG